MRGHEVEIEAIVECENTQMSKRHVQVTLIRDPDGRPPKFLVEITLEYTKGLPR
jgi:Protein of unknown function (DUF3435)